MLRDLLSGRCNHGLCRLIVAFGHITALGRMRTKFRAFGRQNPDQCFARDRALVFCGLWKKKRA
jgi:hypothetical protein